MRKLSETIQEGDKVRGLGGSTSRVLRVTPARVEVKHSDSGLREWVDVLDFNATFKSEQERADAARLVEAIAKARAARQ